MMTLRYCGSHLPIIAIVVLLPTGSTPYHFEPQDQSISVEAIEVAQGGKYLIACVKHTFDPDFQLQFVPIEGRQSTHYINLNDTTRRVVALGRSTLQNSAVFLLRRGAISKGPSPIEIAEVSLHSGYLVQTIASVYPLADVSSLGLTLTKDGATVAMSWEPNNEAVLNLIAIERSTGRRLSHRQIPLKQRRPIQVYWRRLGANGRFLIIINTVVRGEWKTAVLDVGSQAKTIYEGNGRTVSSDLNNAGTALALLRYVGSGNVVLESLAIGAGKARRLFLRKVEDELLHIKFSPDSKRILCYGSNISTPKAFVLVHGFTGSVTVSSRRFQGFCKAAWSPKGDTIVLTEETNIRIWNINRGTIADSGKIHWKSNVGDK